MAGHMGNTRVTTQNLQVVQVDIDRGLVLVKGAVPGPKGGWVMFKDAIKKPVHPDAIFPAARRRDAEAVAEAAAKLKPLWLQRPRPSWQRSRRLNKPLLRLRKNCC